MQQVQLIHNIKHHFLPIQDPRIKNANLFHDLSDIMVLVLLAVICGADGWVQIIVTPIV